VLQCSACMQSLKRQVVCDDFLFKKTSLKSVTAGIVFFQKLARQKRFSLSLLGCFLNTLGCAKVICENFRLAFLKIANPAVTLRENSSC
jgi:hypothetical protein